MLHNIKYYPQNQSDIVIFANMSKFWLLLLVFTLQISVRAQSTAAEEFYVSAFYEMSDMLSGRDTLSIKRAVFLAEWAYYEGKLDYQVDFCDEIDRIKDFVNLFYKVNNLKSYKTGKQMALNAYFLVHIQVMDINLTSMILKHFQQTRTLWKANLSAIH